MRFDFETTEERDGFAAYVLEHLGLIGTNEDTDVIYDVSTRSTIASQLNRIYSEGGLFEDTGTPAEKLRAAYYMRGVEYPDPTPCCKKHFAAIDLNAARIMADKYEGQTGMTLRYKETVGFVPGAVFVFDCFR